jgi:cation-transporting ATPase 13A1
MYQGLKDDERNKNKLFLRCITIITSVVPTELPMIMSLAINSSLAYLKKK